jgi:hypothetical protein
MAFMVDVISLAFLSRQMDSVASRRAIIARADGTFVTNPPIDSLRFQVQNHETWPLNHMERKPMTSMSKIARISALALCAAAALMTMSESALAWRGGCWGCGRGGAFAAGAIAGAALATPYYAPRYYAAPVVVAPPVYAAPPVYSAYPVCPVVGPMPYYCR